MGFTKFAVGLHTGFLARRGGGGVGLFFSKCSSGTGEGGGWGACSPQKITALRLILVGCGSFADYPKFVFKRSSIKPFFNAIMFFKMGGGSQGPPPCMKPCLFLFLFPSAVYATKETADRQV